MNKYEQAAIIGWYRMGASNELIMWAMGIEYYFVEKTIKEYIKSLNS